MPDRLDDYFGFHQRALALRAQRQQLLASNIANADTPDFKARDIDFRPALQAATASAGAAMSPHAAPLLYRLPRQDSIDGNTVELDSERAQFADNALRYEASLSAVDGKIKSLLAVLQGA